MTMISENNQPFILYIGTWFCKHCRAASVELAKYLSEAIIPVYYVDTIESFRDTSEIKLQTVVDTLAPYELLGTPTYYAFDGKTPIAEYIGATITSTDLVEMQNQALSN